MNKENDEKIHKIAETAIFLCFGIAGHAMGNMQHKIEKTTYHEKLGLSILAIGVKPFGYRRKVFRLQP